MAIYLAYQIKDGKLDYPFVISRRPDLKEGIDLELQRQGKEALITVIE